MCMALLLSFSLPLSHCLQLHEGQVMSWLLAFSGLLSGLTAEQIQSCLKVKKLKRPKLPPVSLCVWWQEGVGVGGGAFKREVVVNKQTSFFYGSIPVILTDTNTVKLDPLHAIQTSTIHEKEARSALAHNAPWTSHPTNTQCEDKQEYMSSMRRERQFCKVQLFSQTVTIGE